MSALGKNGPSRRNSNGDFDPSAAFAASNICKNFENRSVKPLDGDILYMLREVQIVTKSWQRRYNTIRPHASLSRKLPTREVFMPAFAAWPAVLHQPSPPATLAPLQILN